MMRRRSSGGKDDDDDHECRAKTSSIDLGGGRGVRNDKVVTSNLAFAGGHISLSAAAAGITFFVRLMKNGEDKQCGISLGGQMIENVESVILPNS